MYHTPRNPLLQIYYKRINKLNIMKKRLKLIGWWVLLISAIAFSMLSSIFLFPIWAIIWVITGWVYPKWLYNFIYNNFPVEVIS